MWVDQLSGAIPGHFGSGSGPYIRSVDPACDRYINFNVLDAVSVEDYLLIVVILKNQHIKITKLFWLIMEALKSSFLISLKNTTN